MVAAEPAATVACAWSWLRIIVRGSYGLECEYDSLLPRWRMWIPVVTLCAGRNSRVLGCWLVLPLQISRVLWFQSRHYTQVRIPGSPYNVVFSWLVLSLQIWRLWMPVVALYAGTNSRVILVLCIVQYHWFPLGTRKIRYDAITSRSNWYSIVL